MVKRAVFVRSAYNYDADEVSLETGVDTGDETPTIQSARDEADINEIVRRFGITGQLPVDLPPLMYGDFTEIGDFRSALEAVMDAQARFGQLPGEVRGRFDNDPQLFLNWCEARDDKGVRVNLEDMRKYGLAVPEVKPVVSPPVKVEVINPVVPGK